ncbi:MAG: hypothetical protein WEB52_10030 [Dehalococcoidia bacterium]
MNHNYTMMIKTQPMPSPSGDLAKSLAMGVPVVLGEVTAFLDGLDGGGWEIVSHSQSVVQDQIATTFLAKRPAVGTPLNGS